MGKKVLILCEGIDDVLAGSDNVAGIQIQLGFWSKMFMSRGWKVFAVTTGEARKVEGVDFLSVKENWEDRHGMSVAHEFRYSFSLIRRVKPDLTIYRGASRFAFAISLWSHVFGAKFLFFGAHDTDFKRGEEMVPGVGLNRTLYHRAIRNVDYFVSQNIVQAQSLKENYGRESLIVQNIWPSALGYRHQGKGTFDVVMVANYRPWKRAEWFVRLAEKMPERKFAMVGGAYLYNMSYYEEVKAMAERVGNVTVFGFQPFSRVNEIVAESKLLVCTSEYEGFPNTFLQAWSACVPVVSTVNPNNVVTDFGLGKLIETEDDLLVATDTLLKDEQLYNQCRENIGQYFEEHHSAEKAIEKLLGYLGI